MDAWFAILVLLAVFLLLLDGVYRGPQLSRAGRWTARRAGRVRRRRPPSSPAPPRPFESLVADARRLAARLDHPRGLSYAKQAALLCCYDRVLGEVCDAVGVAHLLAVLPQGEELDAERARVESMLWLAGVHLDDAA